MLRLSKRADYALIVLNHMGRGHSGEWYRVSDLAARYQIPPEQLNKVMQLLSRAGILTPRVGRNGGYSLARPLTDIALLDVLKALEGEIALAACFDPDAEECEQFEECSVRRPLHGVQERVLEVLQQVTVAEATGTAT